MRRNANRALLAAVSVAAAAWQVPASAVSPTPPAPFTIVGDTVTIYDVTPTVSVSLKALTATVDRLDSTKAAQGEAAAWRMFDALPTDMRAAVLYDTYHVSEFALAPPDPDDYGYGEEEPPVEHKDPTTTVTNVTNTTYVEPVVTCAWRHMEDTRTHKGWLTHRTKYQIKMFADWQGCDNGSNGGGEPFDFFYANVALGWACDHTVLTGDQTPAGPNIVFTMKGQCGPGIDAGEHGTFTAGSKSPFMRNTYDWTGHEVQRAGSAG